VALAEEGWTSGPIVSAVAHRYLDELFAGADAPDTLVLGCTHFPVLADTLREAVGPSVTIVDSAQTAAASLETLLKEKNLLNTQGRGELQLCATDGPERFALVGARFLDEAILTDDVELVDLA
jgi:glutamate racemase